MKKPVIVGDCPGNRELLTDREDALFVTMADAGALANGILELKANHALMEKIAADGYKTFLKRCSTAAIGRELTRILNSATA